MIALGIDPDLHNTAIATWEDDGPGFIKVCHTPCRRGVVGQAAVLAMIGQLPNFHSPDWLIAAVEGQQFKGKRHPRPIDIVHLGQVSGACVALLTQTGNGRVLLPTPFEWKGTIPKRNMQARLYEELGWGYDMRTDYAVPARSPDRFKHLNNTDWRHGGDALLLARWAHGQHGKT